MKYNQQQLIQQYKKEQPLKWLHFWGHTPPRDGSVNQSCLSQWFESSFEVNEVQYKTAEHWMMAHKAALFNDEEMRLKIIASNHPGEAKKLGRKVRNFNPETWNTHKFEIVVEGNRHKFQQNTAMAEFLLATQNRVLVEASPYDQIWGIGLSKDHPDASNPERWRGPNLLGFALMEVRDELSTFYWK